MNPGFSFSNLEEIMNEIINDQEKIVQKLMNNKIIPYLLDQRVEVEFGMIMEYNFVDRIEINYVYLFDNNTKQLIKELLPNIMNTMAIKIQNILTRMKSLIINNSIDYEFKPKTENEIEKLAIDVFQIVDENEDISVYVENDRINILTKNKKKGILFSILYDKDVINNIEKYVNLANNILSNIMDKKIKEQIDKNKDKLLNIINKRKEKSKNIEEMIIQSIKFEKYNI